MSSPVTPLTDRFEDALVYAARLHSNQPRKGSPVPYFAHLMAVTSLVLEDGGDEDQAIAALLHDAVEDQGGRETLEEIRQRYGDRVAGIVAGCTDSYTDPKPPWRQRKEQYLEHLQHAPPDTLRVSLADKLHNARSIALDLKTQHESIFRRFRGGKSGTLWYYRELVKVFEQHSSSPMVAELRAAVSEIERLASTRQS